MIKNDTICIHTNYNLAVIHNGINNLILINKKYFLRYIA